MLYPAYSRVDRKNLVKCEPVHTVPYFSPNFRNKRSTQRHVFYYLTFPRMGIEPPTIVCGHDALNCKI